ncbi:MAG: RIP metalloprotease [Spirochaetales bacterium]
MGISLLATTFTDLLSNVFYIFIAILVLLLMITIHELGHYLAGKKLGFGIKEFSIGFGKKLFSRKNKSGEDFSIRLIPLGGYCAFEGEDEDDNDNPKAFNNQKPWKRLIVLFMGAFFNFLSAIVFAVILLTAYGYDIPQVATVDAESANYGIIQENDVIWGVNGEEINFVTDTSISVLLAEQTVGEPFTLNIERDHEKMDITVSLYAVPALDGEGQPVLDEENNPVFNNVLGITIKLYAFPFFEALGRSFYFVIGMAYKILAFFLLLITGRASLSAIGGPITTITIIASYTQASLAGFVVLLPLIAVNLAVFNLLPIPALDGARMVFVGIEWIRGKPVNRELEAKIHTIGLVVLLAFVLFADFYHMLFA